MKAWNIRTGQAEIELLKEERDSAIAFMNSNAHVISYQEYAIDKLEDKLSKAVELLEEVLEDTLAPDIDEFLETLR